MDVLIGFLTYNQLASHIAIANVDADLPRGDMEAHDDLSFSITPNKRPTTRHDIHIIRSTHAIRSAWPVICREGIIILSYDVCTG